MMLVSSAVRSTLGGLLTCISSMRSRVLDLGGIVASFETVMYNYFVTMTSRETLVAATKLGRRTPPVSQNWELWLCALPSLDGYSRHLPPTSSLAFLDPAR
jgi:hypothetical protein